MVIKLAINCYKLAAPQVVQRGEWPGLVAGPACVPGPGVAAGGACGARGSGLLLQTLHGAGVWQDEHQRCA